MPPESPVPPVPPQTAVPGAPPGTVAVAPDQDSALPRRLTAGLTEAQLEAVMAPERSLCVLAGAGTGKTRVLTLRVARRVRDGSAAEDRVLVCTFSRKAAHELRRRLWALGVGGSLQAGTFHRTALDLIRQHRADQRRAAPVLVADRRPLLAELAAELAAGAARGEADRARGATASWPTSRTASRSTTRALAPPLFLQRAAQLDAEIGWAKARMIAPEEYEHAARRARRRSPGGAARTAELYAAYEQAKRRRGVLDLDDLLWVCGELLEEDPTFAAAVRWRFRHLFVDEMQDVNPAQFRFLQALLGGRADLFAVGDPNQSVYGWNGADPGLLEQLPSLVPGTRVIRLDDNHRCSPQVVAVAAAALGLAEERSPASTRPDGPVPRVAEHATDHEEAAWVAHQAWLAHRPGRRWSQVAVLARTNAQLDVVAEAFAAARVPVRRAGGELAPGSDIEDDAEGEAGDDAEGGGGDRGRAEDGGWSDGTAESAGAEGADDAVVLSTFHRSKGLQWPAVFVIGLSDDLVPIASARTPAARAEERRLLYVALTRAENELYCSWARARRAAAREGDRDPYRDRTLDRTRDRALDRNRGRDRGREVGDGDGRGPSPWLEEVRRAVASLADADRTLAPSDVASRLADLRRSLERQSEGSAP